VVEVSRLDLHHINQNLKYTSSVMIHTKLPAIGQLATPHSKKKAQCHKTRQAGMQRSPLLWGFTVCS